MFDTRLTKKVGSQLEELQREEEMLKAGHDRYLERQDSLKQLSLNNNANAIIEKTVEKVSSRIAEIVATQAQPGQGRKFDWRDDLEKVNTDILAYMGLVTCMDAAGDNWTRTKTLKAIGDKVEMEHYAVALKEYDSKLAKRVERVAVTHNTSLMHRRKAVRSIAAKEGFHCASWDDERKIKAASPILSAILEVSDVFEIWSHKKDNKSIYKLGLTDEASAEFANLEMAVAWNEPVFTPMIVEPVGWSDFYTGAYLDNSLSSICPLARNCSKRQRKALQRAIEDGTMQPTLDALNAVQRTPYQINEYVLDAVNWCWFANNAPGTMPNREKPDLVTFPDNYDELDEFEKKGWRLKQGALKRLRRQIDGGRANMNRDMKVAKELAEYDRFYLPHSLDFRGRVYPIPSFSHHREDHIKAMFYLANAKPLGEKGIYWIAVQIANTGDFDKISKGSLDERIQWVVNNEDLVMKVGTDFIRSFDIWSQADKPFQFLAACREYVRWQKHDDSQGEFLSGLPVALDGSNSGIQHFSAASLTAVDGALVNLIPSDRPQDIYQAVADVVIKRIADCSSDEAAEWRKFGITRKVVKRNVMTYGYSATKFGFREQIMEDTMTPLRTAETKGEIDEMPFRDANAASGYLAEHNWTAINQVVQGASEGMEFFRKLAGICADYNKTMTWQTPLGFVCDNSYYKTETKVLRIFLYDRTVGAPQRKNVKLNKRSNKVDKRKCMSAIAPNVIHSLDSSHLLATVLACLQESVRDFVLIHDSFATTPGDTHKLFQLVRETFVAQYEGTCIYQDIMDQVVRNIPEVDSSKLPLIPAKGDLDLSGILVSDYCFA